MKINKLTLAYMDGCPHCLTAQLALKKYGVTYEKLNWSLDSNDAIFENSESAKSRFFSSLAKTEAKGLRAKTPSRIMR